MKVRPADGYFIPVLWTWLPQGQGRLFRLDIITDFFPKFSLVKFCCAYLGLLSLAYCLRPHIRTAYNFELGAGSESPIFMAYISNPKKWALSPLLSFSQSIACLCSSVKESAIQTRVLAFRPEAYVINLPRWSWSVLPN